MISAVGVVGNVEGLGLEALGVKLERGLIVADGVGRTSVAGIYAIGDVAGRAHARAQGRARGRHLRRGHQGARRSSARQAARARLHLQPPADRLRRAHRGTRQGRRARLRIGRFPFRANGKALALGEREGLVKTIFDAGTGELIGAHMIGAEVTELIQGFVIAMQLEATEEDLMRTVFPHPTLSEMMGESALAAYGRALHIPPAGKTSG